MAERKLNINAPLMSVRRSSATSPSLTEAKKKMLEKRHSLPYYKSDMSSDQVTEPVAVPFNWEHIPGRRKANGGSEPQPLPKESSITPSPRLPPGKSISATKQPLEKENSDKERKAEKKVENRKSNVEALEEKEEDDVYSDALETLSHSELFSMNCSVSGVSGPIPAVKKAWEAIHKNKSSSGAASPDMQEGRKKWSSESNRFTYSGELLPGRLSPFRRSRAAAAGVSPSRSKPQSPFRGAKLLGDSKEVVNSKSGNLKFLSTGLGNNQGAKRGSYSGSLAMEKTLYIDTASTVKLSSSNLSSVDNKHKVDTVIADLDKRRGKESNSTIESSQEIRHVQVLEEKNTLDYEVLRSMGINSSTLSSMLHLIGKEDKDEGLTTDQDINQEMESFQLVQGTSAEESKANNQQIVLANGSGKSGVGSAQSPLPPPLPKSPSESWLWRALPIASVKNSFLHSKQGTQSHAKRHDSNTTSSNIKWETIVKTSNLHHDHVRYSQELTTHKSKHSKS
ncbi:hypothetical protein SESBI_28267 [Sesbania bispinosa]|nr:hypothetical protein SESBI_28267 [Sesbania bispinosa]